MIQRIQTLYLILTTLFPVIFLKTGFLKFINKSGNELLLNFTGVTVLTQNSMPESPEKGIILITLAAFISVISLISVFLFRNRSMQLKFTTLVIISVILLIAFVLWSGFSISSEYQAELVPGLNVLIPPVLLFFAIMAYRRIRRDEELVRSYDRLR